jgi:MFS family permease
VFGFGPRGVGYFFGGAGIVIIIVQGGLIGKLTRRFGEWTIVIAGPALVTIAMALFIEAGLRQLLWILLVGGLFNAMGRSLQTPALSSLISKHSDPKMHGTVFGMNHMLMSLARVLGPAIATVYYTGHHTSPYWIAGAISLAVALWTTALRGGGAGARRAELSVVSSGAGAK